MAQDVARYERNLREELDGSALYAALAAAEIDPVRKDLFLQLSKSPRSTGGASRSQSGRKMEPRSSASARTNGWSSTSPSFLSG
jgi:hypothetical protein